MLFRVHRFHDDCSRYLLLASGNHFDTSEIGVAVSPKHVAIGAQTSSYRYRRGVRVQGQLLFMVAAQPSATVRCPLHVVPLQEAFVEPDELLITPENWSIPISVAVTGKPDWVSDGDTPFAVRVGACESMDARFRSMGYPDNPSVTEHTGVNVDVPMPYVKHVMPSAVHVSGSMVTVVGAHIPATAIVSFGPYVVSDSSWARRRATPMPWSWIFNNGTQTMQPVRTELLSQLQTADVDGRTVLVDPSYNRTLCAVMQDEGFVIDDSTPNSTHNSTPHTRRKQADPRMLGLLQYSWISDSKISFVTPCVKVRAVRSAFFWQVFLAIKHST